jgi:maleylacetoacetate isomerase
VKLYTYWRSSAAYRVRIALNLKGLAYESVPVDLAPAAAEQLAAPFAAVTPEQRVPVLEHDGVRLTQSLAIMEYLEESHPAPPLLPADPVSRARGRALAQLVACDIHPLNNLSVLVYLRRELGADDTAVNAWYRHWVVRGLRAIEAHLRAAPAPYCCGESPGLADACLVPQLYNARRFDCDLSDVPEAVRIEQACLALAAFDDARPERQSDAPGGA